MAVMNWRNRTKLKLVDYKGGKCETCGYNKRIPPAYHFHHKDPEQKDFGISSQSLSFEKQKAEVDKCLLLCATCHQELHWELDQELRSERMVLNRKMYPKTITCAFCKKESRRKWYQQKYCDGECAKKAQRKVVDRPSKEQLMIELQSHTYVELGKKYGVRDNSIKKWVRNYGIALERRKPGPLISHNPVPSS